MTIEDKIAKEMERLISELIDSHNRLGMKSSGSWIDSLEYEVNGTTSKILGEDYTQYLVKGRPPNKKQSHQDKVKWAAWASNPDYAPEGGFIHEWATIRGVAEYAFQIAYGIADKGTTWHQKGGSDLLEAVFTQENLDKVRDGVADVVRLTTAEYLIRQLQTA